MYEIAKISYRHEAIIDWLLANPDRPLIACARELGYTQAWLSVIINSEMFQAAYHARATRYHAEVEASIRDRMLATASLSLEATAERISRGDASERLLTDTNKNVLQMLGYGASREPGNGGGGQHVHFHQTNVDAKTILEARERAAKRHLGNSRELREGQVVESS